MNIGIVYRILERHSKEYPAPVVGLVRIQSNDPFKILVSAILSPRTKDQATADASQKLFLRADSLEKLSALSREEIEKAIHSVGFHKNKAKYLKKLPEAIKAKFNGRIPRTSDKLMQLPGVGRKVANLVASAAFGKQEITVDTHVHRIMNRLGYVSTKNPEQTEKALRLKLPKKYWKKINYVLVAFGQNTCKPVSPICSKCPLRTHCKRAGVTISR